VTSIGRSAFDDRSITSINYTGTTKQWSAIKRDQDGINGTKITVHCSDGDVIDNFSI